MRRAGARGGRPARRGAAKPAPAPQPERLQKVLAQAGLGSRREAEAWIRAGRLTINGVVATLGAKVAPDDELRLDGRAVHARMPAGGRIFLCHRSPGEPLTESTEAARAPMAGRIPRRLGRRLVAVSPMPRADGGLELLTSDGELAARLQRGVHALASEFGVRVHGELNEAQLQGVLGGELDSGAQLAIERCEPSGGEGANRWYQITARGTSGRELRRLLERQGAQVSRVLRTRLGPLTLERSLPRGRFRELSPDELRALLSADQVAEAAGRGAGG